MNSETITYVLNKMSIFLLTAFLEGKSGTPLDGEQGVFCLGVMSLFTNEFFFENMSLTRPQS